MRLLGLLSVFLAALAAFACPARSQPDPGVVVFAAASLAEALQDVAEAYAKAGGPKPRISLAASSTLAKQIEAGAGAQIFISADEVWMDYLEKRGLIAAATRRPLLGNRLVLVTPASHPLQLDLSSGRWLEQLPAGRIATGDPAHVPVGLYARQALTRLGLWDEISRRLAAADNVRNALVLVERGEAVAGIVYKTDALISRRTAIAGTFPESSHDAIVYPVALARGHEDGNSRKFYDFLLTRAALDIFAKHGFIAVPS